MYPRFYTFACGPKTPSWLTVSAISRSEGGHPQVRRGNPLGRSGTTKTAYRPVVIISHHGI